MSNSWIVSLFQRYIWYLKKANISLVVMLLCYPSTITINMPLFTKCCLQGSGDTTTYSSKSVFRKSFYELRFFTTCNDIGGKCFVRLAPKHLLPFVYTVRTRGLTILWPGSTRSCKLNTNHIKDVCILVSLMSPRVTRFLMRQKNSHTRPS